MKPDRRTFLTASAGTLAVAATGAAPVLAGPVQGNNDPPRRRNRIAVSTYSYWQFRHKDLRSIETCIDLAAEMGFDGVEILHRQMEQEDNAYLQRLKRRAFLGGRGHRRCGGGRAARSSLGLRLWRLHLCSFCLVC